MIRRLSFWRATVLVAVLLSHASSIFVHAGGDRRAVTDRTLDQVPTHASGGKIAGRSTTRVRLPKFLKAITRDVKEVTQVDCCERTCEDARVHDGVDHTLDNCPLTDLYRNRHFFEKTSVNQRQRWADLLAVVGSINRAQKPFDDLYQWHFIIKKGREYRCNRLLSRNSDVAGHFRSVQDAFEFDDERGRDGVFLMHLKDGGWYSEERSTLDPRVPNLTFPLFSWSRLERHDLVGKKRQRELLMPTYARHIEKLDAFCASTENLNKTHWANTRNHEKVLGRFRERCGNQGARNLWNGEQFDACERKFLSKLAEQHTDLLDIHPVGNDSWNLTVADPIAADKFDTSYAFEISTNGFGGDGGLMRKFASNTVIFYSKPLYKQLLDDELVPWRHYVPILDESSVDLLHNFRMLKADPDLAWRIARNGRNLVCARLSEEPRKTWFREVFGFINEIMGDVPGWEDLEQELGPLHSCKA